MPDLGLNGPYALTTSKINEVVTRTSPGAYVLGKTNEGTFYISYVGRADKDINARLKEHVGNYSQFEYDYFFLRRQLLRKNAIFGTILNLPITYCIPIVLTAANGNAPDAGVSVNLAGVADWPTNLSCRTAPSGSRNSSTRALGYQHRDGVAPRHSGAHSLPAISLDGQCAYPMFRQGRHWQAPYEWRRVRAP